LALKALESESSVDELMQDVQGTGLELNPDYSRSINNQDSSSRVTGIKPVDDNLLAPYSCMLDSLLADSHVSYSAWSTTGSERVEPCLFTTQGLPPLHGLTAMLDGQWIQWNWKQPYNLKTNT
ncbi:MAG: hypothetical protein OEY89_17730, partial [Gammaproteobacteria bacterium]|nr:hypothetical protein [Gammaproteobacteria bacterium]